MPKKVKVITTELGQEKQCTGCGEFYPIHRDFFYRDGKREDGTTKYVAQCKACYVSNYRPKRSFKREFSY